MEMRQARDMHLWLKTLGFLYLNAPVIMAQTTAHLFILCLFTNEYVVISCNSKYIQIKKMVVG